MKIELSFFNIVEVVYKPVFSLGLQHQNCLWSMIVFVPVIDKNNKPLMPTIPSRAKKWISSGKATPFWKKGLFCVKLNVEPSNRKTQNICTGIDPGSKREAYTVKSNAHTYLNILSETIDWVSKAIEQKKNMRRSRRFRNTRYRIARFNNRKGSFLVPSTRARWELKLNVCKWLSKIISITHYCVEDVCARTIKGKRRWNKSFSPLEVGKNWFYGELRKLGNLSTKQGYETKELRDDLGLKKSSSKLADKFECHNVDSWVLANCVVGGHREVDNKIIFKLVPIRFHRRQLHVLQPSKGGVRKEYGSTRSMGFKRGSLIKHKKYGLCYVGGSSKGRISLHDLRDGVRVCRNAKVGDCVFKSYMSFILKGGEQSFSPY